MLDLGKVCGMPSDAIIQAFDIVQGDSPKLYLCFAWHPGNSDKSNLAVMMPFMQSTLMKHLSEGTNIGEVPYEKREEFVLVQQIIMVFAYPQLIPSYPLMVYFDVSRVPSRNLRRATTPQSF